MPHGHLPGNPMKCPCHGETPFLGPGGIVYGVVFSWGVGEGERASERRDRMRWPVCLQHSGGGHKTMGSCLAGSRGHCKEFGFYAA